MKSLNAPSAEEPHTEDPKLMTCLVIVTMALYLSHGARSAVALEAVVDTQIARTGEMIIPDATIPLSAPSTMTDFQTF